MSTAPLPYVLMRAPRLSLAQAAARAATMSEPLRLRHDDGELFAEVFFFREHVLHAHVNGLDGVRALAALLLCNLRFAVDTGVWPSRCTIVATWDVACREAELVRRRPPAVVRTDEDATERLA